MPRVNNIYELPPGSYGVSGETVKSAPYNTVLDDLKNDANNPRPVTAGGTGANSPVGSADNLSTTGTDIASSTTTNLAAATGVNVTITGTTAVTGFGVAPAGIKRWLTFAGALTLTYNATKLILPGAANITTAAGDTCVALSLGSGNWRVVSYTRADGKAVSTSSADDLLAAIKTVDGDGSGLDADLLDGQHGTFYRNASNINDGTLNAGFLPAGVLPTAPSSGGTVDFNTLVAPGWQPSVYLGSNANGPGDNNYYWVLNLLYTGGPNLTQLAIHYALPATDILIRGRYDGTWTEWHKVAMAADVVPKTGGTFTGSVGINGGALVVQNGPTNDYAAIFTANSASWGAVLGYAQDGVTYGILGTQNAYSFQGRGLIYNDGGALLTGGIETNGSFKGTSTVAILGTNGPTGNYGYVYLRPKGYNDPNAQAYVDYNGNFFASGAVYAAGDGRLDINGNIYGSVWGGYLSTWISNNLLSPSNLMSQVAAQSSMGGLGTYAFCRLAGGGTCGPGDGIAGSSLRYADSAGTGSTALPGSWVCRGQIVTANNNTLFSRYA